MRASQVAEWLGDDPRTVLKVYAHVLGEQQTIEGIRRACDVSSHLTCPNDVLSFAGILNAFLERVEGADTCPHVPWSPEIPFNDLPAPPPDGIDLEPKAVLKATVEARTVLATLAQAGRLPPNPSILIHAIPLLEAQASSEIENIVTTADELFKHADSGGGDHATKEALRYRGALFAGVDSIKSRPLTAATAARVCSELHGREMDVRAVPGTRIANPTTHEIVYAPPEGADVIRQKLSAWERFVHAEDDLDPLVRMAVATRSSSACCSSSLTVASAPSRSGARSRGRPRRLGCTPWLPQTCSGTSRSAGSSFSSTTSS